MRKTYVVRERTGLFRPTRRREVEALRGVSLEVGRGEFVALLGRNGAGKTTLLKIVATLLLPTAGAVTVAGYDALRHPREVRRRIGLALAGERTLYWKLTGLENLRLFGGLYDVPRRRAHARATELLDLVGLSEFRNVAVEKYSTGMRKRLALAKALIHDPLVLVLDEPTAGLDPHGVEHIWRILRALQGERKVTVLMATHNMDEAETLPDRVVVIEEGRVVADDAPERVKLRTGATPTAVLTVSGAIADPGSLGVGARAYPLGDGRFRVVAPASHLPDLVVRIRADGLALESVEMKESTLWDAFLKLTGTPFDDVEAAEEEG